MPKKSDAAWYAHHKEYNAEYNRKNTYNASVKFNKKTDAEVIDIWLSVPNKTEFLRQALLEYAKKIGY